MTTHAGASDTQAAIAAALRAELARQQKSQREIASATGIGTTVLNRYFQGTREVPSTTLFTIVSALGADMGAFWDDVMAERNRLSA